MPEVERQKVLQMARSLIERDGTRFTLAELCRQNKFNKSALRRIFPTKALLIAALAAQSESKRQAKIARPAATENQDWLQRKFRIFERAIKLIEQRLETIQQRVSSYESTRNRTRLFSTVTESDQSINELSPIVSNKFDYRENIASAEPALNNVAHQSAVASLPKIDPESLPPFVNRINQKGGVSATAAYGGDWLEQRFSGFERTIELLELKITEIGRPTAASCALSVCEVPPKEAMHVVTIEESDLPLLCEELSEPHVGHESSNGEYDERAEHASSSAAALEEFCETTIPLTTRTLAMRGVLERARVLANSAHIEVTQTLSRKAILRLVVVSILIILMGVIVGFATSGDAARATQASVVDDGRMHPQRPNVTIINAAGAAALSMAPKSADIGKLQRDAAGGDTRAQSALAVAYLRGAGINKDPIAAAAWAQLAAAKGEPAAQLILGSLYTDGIKPDPVSAFKWLSAAAGRGNVKAMHNLGIAYLSGAGVPKNSTVAATWFDKAARLGYQDSAFDLAVLYERGDGVSQNPKIALHWYDEAASTGDQEAAKRASLLRAALIESAKY